MQPDADENEEQCIITRFFARKFPREVAPSFAAPASRRERRVLTEALFRVAQRDLDEFGPYVAAQWALHRAASRVRVPSVARALAERARGLEARTWPLPTALALFLRGHVLRGEHYDAAYVALHFDRVRKNMRAFATLVPRSSAETRRSVADLHDLALRARARSVRACVYATVLAIAERCCCSPGAASDPDEDAPRTELLEAALTLLRDKRMVRAVRGDVSASRAVRVVRAALSQVYEETMDDEEAADFVARIGRAREEQHGGGRGPSFTPVRPAAASSPPLPHGRARGERNASGQQIGGEGREQLAQWAQQWLQWLRGPSGNPGQNIIRASPFVHVRTPSPPISNFIKVASPDSSLRALLSALGALAVSRDDAEKEMAIEVATSQRPLMSGAVARVSATGAAAGLDGGTDILSAVAAVAAMAKGADHHPVVLRDHRVRRALANVAPVALAHYLSSDAGLDEYYGAVLHEDDHRRPVQQQRSEHALSLLASLRELFRFIARAKSSSGVQDEEDHAARFISVNVPGVDASALTEDGGVDVQRYISRAIDQLAGTAFRGIADLMAPRFAHVFAEGAEESTLMRHLGRYVATRAAAAAEEHEHGEEEADQPDDDDVSAALRWAVQRVRPSATSTAAARAEEEGGGGAVQQQPQQAGGARGRREDEDDVKDDKFVLLRAYPESALFPVAGALALLASIFHLRRDRVWSAEEKREQADAVGTLYAAMSPEAFAAAYAAYHAEEVAAGSSAVSAAELGDALRLQPALLRFGKPRAEARDGDGHGHGHDRQSPEAAELRRKTSIAQLSTAARVVKATVLRATPADLFASQAYEYDAAQASDTVDARVATTERVVALLVCASATRVPVSAAPLALVVTLDLLLDVDVPVMPPLQPDATDAGYTDDGHPSSASAATPLALFEALAHMAWLALQAKRERPPTATKDLLREVYEKYAGIEKTAVAAGAHRGDGLSYGTAEAKRTVDHLLSRRPERENAGDALASAAPPDRRTFLKSVGGHPMFRSLRALLAHLDARAQHDPVEAAACRIRVMAQVLTNLQAAFPWFRAVPPDYVLTLRTLDALYPEIEAGSSGDAVQPGNAATATPQQHPSYASPRERLLLGWAMCDAFRAFKYIEAKLRDAREDVERTGRDVHYANPASQEDVPLARIANRVLKAEAAFFRAFNVVLSDELRERLRGAVNCPREHEHGADEPEAAPVVALREGEGEGDDGEPPPPHIAIRSPAPAAAAATAAPAPTPAAAPHIVLGPPAPAPTSPSPPPQPPFVAVGAPGRNEEATAAEEEEEGGERGAAVFLRVGAPAPPPSVLPQEPHDDALRKSRRDAAEFDASVHHLDRKARAMIKAAARAVGKCGTASTLRNKLLVRSGIGDILASLNTLTDVPVPITTPATRVTFVRRLSDRVAHLQEEARRVMREYEGTALAALRAAEYLDDDENFSSARRIPPGDTDPHAEENVVQTLEQQILGEQERKRAMVEDVHRTLADEDARREQERKGRFLDERAGGRPVRLQGKNDLVLGFFKVDLVLLYLLKALRLGVQVVTLFAAQKVFQEQYVRRVHVEKRDPPPLRDMLLAFLGLDATVLIMLLLMVVAVSFVYKRPENAFVMDDAFLGAVLTEYIATSIVTLLLGLGIASVLFRHRYFAYKYQGIATSRAYRDVMTAVIAFVAVVPFALVLRSAAP